MSNYFTDEQIFKLAKQAGFEESKTFDRFFDKAEMGQLRALMNLAVKTAIGSPLYEIDYGTRACPDWQPITDDDFKNEEFHPIRKIYTIKEIAE